MDFSWQHLKAEVARLREARATALRLPGGIDDSQDKQDSQFVYLMASLWVHFHAAKGLRHLLESQMARIFKLDGFLGWKEIADIQAEIDAVVASKRTAEHILEDCHEEFLEALESETVKLNFLRTTFVLSKHELFHDLQETEAEAAAEAAAEPAAKKARKGENPSTKEPCVNSEAASSSEAESPCRIEGII